MIPARGCSHFSTFSPQCFGSLPTAALRDFHSLGVYHHHPSNRVLLREGFPADHVLIICSGRAKLVASSPDGRLFLLRIAQTDDILGLAALLEQAVYRVTAETLTPCTIKSIYRTDFLRFMEDYPQVSRDTSRAIVRDYNSAVLSARRLALHTSAAGKLASTLLDWARMAESDASLSDTSLPISFSMPITHEELGSMAGLSRETVGRLLSRFRQEGLICQTHDRMTLKRPDQLESRYC